MTPPSYGLHLAAQLEHQLLKSGDESKKETVDKRMKHSFQSFLSVYGQWCCSCSLSLMWVTHGNSDSQMDNHEKTLTFDCEDLNRRRRQSRYKSALRNIDHKNIYIFFG